MCSSLQNYMKNSGFPSVGDKVQGRSIKNPYFSKVPLVEWRMESGE